MAPRRDTSLGGDARSFPSTRWSLLLEVRNRESPAYRRALEDLCRYYWKPIYAYIRAARGVGNEEAKDLTQEFLIDIVDGTFLERFAPEQGSFRGYLAGAIHLFLREQHRRAGALKRGGGRKILAFGEGETRDVDRWVAASDLSPDDAFERQWANSVIDLAVRDLEEELGRMGKGRWLLVFDRYELHPPSEEKTSYESLAREFEMERWEVKYCLQSCRKALRRHVLKRIEDYVGAKPHLDDEVKLLFPQ